jgi:hypothetical protein
MFTDCGDALRAGGVRDATTAAGASPWQPHAPWSAMPTPQDSAFPYPPTNASCWAQRYRITIANATSSSIIPDDGCGTWGVAAPGACAIDAQPAHCNIDSAVMVAAALTGAAVSINVTATLIDTFSLDQSTSTVAVPLNITFVPSAEPPVVGWADVPTLSALGLSVSSPQLPLLNQIFIDDVTGSGTSASALPAPLVICSQRAADVAVGGAVIDVSPSIEDPGAANVSAFQVGAPKLLPLTSAPACAAAFRTSGAGVVTAAVESGVVWVAAYTLRAAPAALSTTPVRLLTVSAVARAPSRTALTAVPLAIPLRITRANQPVAWDLLATPLLLNEYAPVGASAGTVTVSDADISQDVSFSVVNATLRACGSASPMMPSRDWAYLFSLAPLSRIVSVTDVVTGVTSQVNASRSASLVVAVDGLDAGDFAAACNQPPVFPRSSCVFTVVLRAVDSGNASATHSRLPSAPPTTADGTFNVSVLANPNATLPVINSVLGAPSGGLSPRGGDELTFIGSNLGLPASATSNITAALVTVKGDSFPLACTVVVRQTRMRCITSPGWGVNLSLSFAIGFLASSTTSGSVLSYAAPRGIETYVNSNATNGETVSFSARALAGSLAAASVGNGAPLASPLALGFLQPTRTSSRTTLQFTPFSYCFVDGSGRFLNPQPNTSTENDVIGVRCESPVGVVGGDAVITDGRAADASSAVAFPAAGAPRRPLAAVPSLLSPRLSLPPTIIRVTQDCSSATTCGRFLVLGQNLGSSYARRNPNSSAASSDASRLVDSLDGFDRIEYAVNSSAAINGTAGIDCGGSAENAALLLLESSCALHVAPNCTVVASGVAVSCELDPAGWGTGFRVRAVVRGAVSTWSADRIVYPPPTISNVTVVWASGAPYGSALALAPQVSGGSILLISGSGLSPLSQLTLTFGGIVLTPLTGFASDSRTSLLPYDARGAATNSAPSSTAAYHSIFVCAPPGIGTVTLVAVVGARSTSTLVSYAEFKLSSFPGALIDRSTLKDQYIKFGVGVDALSPCTVCFSNLISSAKKLPSVCDAAAPFGPARPAGVATCLYYADALPISNASVCAFPDSMWAWSDRAACVRGKGGVPPTALLGKPTPSRVLCSNVTDPLFIASVNISGPGATFENYVRQDRRNFSVIVSSSPRNGSAFVVSSALRAGKINSGFSSVVGDVSMYSSIDFNIVNLISGQPSLRRLDVVGNSNYKLLPRGGTIVNISLANAYRYGWVIVSPLGAGSIDVGGPSTCSSKLDKASREKQLGPTMGFPWIAGPFVCPITWSTMMRNEFEGSFVAGLNGLNPDDAYLPTVVRLRNDTANRLRLTNLSISLIGNDVELSSELRNAFNDFVMQQTGLGDRIMIESCSFNFSWLEVESEKLPCRVTTWGGSKTTSTDNYVTFSAPPWAGTVKVALFAQSLFSVNEKLVEYDVPVISNMIKNGATIDSTIATDGSVVTISGKNFGLSSTLGRLWELSGASLMGRLVTPHMSVGPARVLFSYDPEIASDAMTPRYCDPVLSWNDSMIVCIAPESASGQKTTVKVGASAPVLGSQNFSIGYGLPFTSPIKYSNPTLVSLTPANGSCTGGYVVIARGRDLSRFVIEKSKLPEKLPWTVNNITSLMDSAIKMLDQGSTVRPPDASAGGLFFAVVSVGGNTSGSIDPNLPTISVFDAPVFFVNHTAVGFIMPPFEGTVDVTLKIKTLTSTDSSSTDSSLQSTLKFSSLPPKIKSVRAFNRSSFEYDADPCLALVRRPQIDDDVCVSIAFNISDDSRPLSNVTPCFRASPTPAGSQTLLEIIGENFGNDRPAGDGGVEVWLLPSQPWRATASVNDLVDDLPSNNGNAKSNPNGGVRCLTASAKTTPWISASKLECSISAPLAVGMYDVVVKTKYSAASSSSTGITPQAVCACGTYAEPPSGNVSRFCKTCPPGASCAGGLAQPRALADSWQTLQAEFKDRGLDDPIGRGVPLFFLCPSTGTCRGNNTCVDGNEGWACTTCSSSWAPQNGQCVKCRDSENVFVYIGIAILCLAVPLWYYIKPRMAQLTTQTTDALFGMCKKKGGRCESKHEDLKRGETCPSCGKVLAEQIRRERPPISAYAKIFLTYFQTVGALNSYLMGNAATQQKAQKAAQELVSSMLPALIKALSFFNSLGKALPSVYCAFPWLGNFYLRYVVTLTTPILIAIAVVVGFNMARIARGIMQWGERVWREGKRRTLTVMHSIRALQLAVDPTSAIADSERTPAVVGTADEGKNATYWVVVAMFAVLPDTINFLASVQLCTGNSLNYLSVDARMSCYEPFFQRAQAAAMVFGYGYLMLPLFAAWALWTSIDDKASWARKNLVFMTEGYRDNHPVAFVWENFAFVRTVLVLGLASDFVGFVDPRSQVAATVFLLTVSIGLHVSVQPYMSSHLNFLEGVALCSTLSTCFAVMIRLVGSSGEVSMFSPCIGFLSAVDCTAAAADADPAAGADLKLQKIRDSDIAMFDFIAICVTTLFFFLLLLMVLDDFVFLGKGEELLNRTLERISEWQATDAAKEELAEAAADEQRQKEKEFLESNEALLSSVEDDLARDSKRGSPVDFKEALAAHEAALAAQRAEAERYAIWAEKNRHWYRIVDHHGTTFWRNEQLAVSQVELPLDATTTSGWCRRINEKTGRLFFFNNSRYKSGDVNGSVSFYLPSDDIRPGPTDAARAAGGAWALESRDDGHGRELWCNCEDGTRTSEPPPRAFSAKGGWRRIPNAQGIIFWHADEIPASCSRPPAADIWGDRHYPTRMHAKSTAAQRPDADLDGPDDGERIAIVVPSSAPPEKDELAHVRFIVKNRTEHEKKRNERRRPVSSRPSLSSSPFVPVPPTASPTAQLVSTLDEGAEFSVPNPLLAQTMNAAVAADAAAQPLPTPLPLSEEEKRKERKKWKRLGRGDETVAPWAPLGYASKLDENVIDTVEKARKLEARLAQAKERAALRARPGPVTAAAAEMVSGQEIDGEVLFTTNPMHAGGGASISQPAIADAHNADAAIASTRGDADSALVSSNPLHNPQARPPDADDATPAPRARPPVVLVKDVDSFVKEALAVQRRTEEREAKKRSKSAARKKAAVATAVLLAPDVERVLSNPLHRPLVDGDRGAGIPPMTVRDAASATSGAASGANAGGASSLHSTGDAANDETLLSTINPLRSPE